MPAYELRAGADRDSASVDFWVPVPKLPGPYGVDLNVAPLGLSGARAGFLTDPFG